MMTTDARKLGPWLTAVAMVLGGVVGCAAGGSHTVTTNNGGATGSAGTAAAGSTGTAGDTGTAGTGAAGTTSTGGTTGTAGVGSAGTTGAAGSAGTTGAAGTAGTSATGGSAGGAAGTAVGGSTGTGGVADMGDQGPFDCTLVAGLLVTGEWYGAGFENDGVDGTKWEGKFQHYGYINIWMQDPPAGYAWTAPITSPCTKNSTNPDRVIWTAWSWELQYMDDVYVADTAAAVKKFMTNYPGMRRMDLMTIVRCPGDEVTMPTGKMCNPNAKIPPTQASSPTANDGTDHNAGQQDCFVPANVDASLAKVAAMFPGKVFVGKKFYSPMCQNPPNGAHLYSWNTQIAKDIAAYYKTGVP